MKQSRVTLKLRQFIQKTPKINLVLYKISLKISTRMYNLNCGTWLLRCDIDSELISGLKDNTNFSLCRSFEGQCASRCCRLCIVLIHCSGGLAQRDQGSPTPALRSPDGGQFGGPYPSGCPLALVFLLSVWGLRISHRLLQHRQEKSPN